MLQGTCSFEHVPCLSFHINLILSPLSLTFHTHTHTHTSQETIQYELCRKDLDSVNKAYAAEELAIKKGGGKYKLSPVFLSTFTKLRDLLERNVPVRSGEWTTGEVEMINEKTSLITTKPVVYLANLSKADFIRKKNKWLPKIHAWIQEHGGGSLIPFSVEYEQALWALREDKAKEAAFLAECSGATSALPKMITSGFTALSLIYYFTCGEKEVRAWTVASGATAPEAAAVIHTDFQKGFVKAEVVAFEDYRSLCDGQKSMAPVKAAGKYRIEGKTYIVQNGDILHFQIGQLTAPSKKK
jgi:obg-like ATPase 1